jgi:hypothetical protein
MGPADNSLEDRMTKAIAVQSSAITAADLAPEVLESLIVKGDCSALTPPQRVAYYRARCDAAGLDYRTQPLMFLTLQGKMILYATKGASDQLAANNGIVCEVLDQKTENGVRTVTVRSRTKDGRQTDEIGCVAVQNKSGDDLCNAYMKAVTKAKRRAVLSLCGLGMMDETEIETIPNAVVIQHDVDSAPQPQAVEPVALPKRKSAKAKDGVGAVSNPPAVVTPPVAAAPHPAPSASPDPTTGSTGVNLVGSIPPAVAAPTTPPATTAKPQSGTAPATSPTPSQPTTPATQTPPSSDLVTKQVEAGIMDITAQEHTPQGKPKQTYWAIRLAIKGEASPMSVNCWSSTLHGILVEAMESGLAIEAKLQGKQGKTSMLWRIVEAEAIGLEG